MYEKACKYCMCLNCPRLLIPNGNRGHCDSCKNCKKQIPFVDINKGDYCSWKKEYEKYCNSNRKN